MYKYLVFFSYTTKDGSSKFGHVDIKSNRRFGCGKNTDDYINRVTNELLEKLQEHNQDVTECVMTNIVRLPL